MNGKSKSVLISKNNEIKLIKEKLNIQKKKINTKNQTNLNLTDKLNNIEEKINIIKENNKKLEEIYVINNNNAIKKNENIFLETKKKLEEGKKEVDIINNYIIMYNNQIKDIKEKYINIETEINNNLNILNDNLLELNKIILDFEENKNEILINKTNNELIELNNKKTDIKNIKIINNEKGIKEFVELYLNKDKNDIKTEDLNNFLIEKLLIFFNKYNNDFYHHFDIYINNNKTNEFFNLNINNFLFGIKKYENKIIFNEKFSIEESIEFYFELSLTEANYKKITSNEKFGNLLFKYHEILENVQKFGKKLIEEGNLFIIEIKNENFLSKYEKKKEKLKILEETQKNGEENDEMKNKIAHLKIKIYEKKLKTFNYEINNTEDFDINLFKLKIIQINNILNKIKEIKNIFHKEKIKEVFDFGEEILKNINNNIIEDFDFTQFDKIKTTKNKIKNQTTKKKLEYYYGFYIKPQYLVKKFINSERFIEIIKNTKYVYNIIEELKLETKSIVFNNRDRLFKYENEILKVKTPAKYTNDGSLALNGVPTDIGNLFFFDNFNQKLSDHLIATLIGKKCVYEDFKKFFKNILNDDLNEIKQTTYILKIDNNKHKLIENNNNIIETHINISIKLINDLVGSADLNETDENNYKCGFSNMNQKNKMYEFYENENKIKNFDKINWIYQIYLNIINGNDEFCNYFNYRGVNSNDILKDIKSQDKKVDSLHKFLSLMRFLMEDIEHFKDMISDSFFIIKEDREKFKIEYFNILVNEHIYERSDIFNEFNQLNPNDRRTKLSGQKNKLFLKNNQIFEQIKELFCKTINASKINSINLEKDKITFYNKLISLENYYKNIVKLYKLCYIKIDILNQKDIQYFLNNFKNLAIVLDDIRIYISIFSQLINLFPDYLSCLVFFFIDYVENLQCLSYSMEVDENINYVSRKIIQNNCVKLGGKASIPLKDIHTKETIKLDKNNNYLYQCLIRTLFIFKNNLIYKNENIETTFNERINDDDNIKLVNFLQNEEDIDINDKNFKKLKENFNFNNDIYQKLLLIKERIKKNQNIFEIKDNKLKLPEFILNKNIIKEYQLSLIEKIYFNLLNGKNSTLGLQMGLGIKLFNY
jgi:hypothetical protein